MQKRTNEDDWHGTKLSVTIEGAWGVYRAYLLRYLRQIAVITPYAQFQFEFKAREERNNLTLHFKRRTDVMPEPPLQVLPAIALRL